MNETMGRGYARFEALKARVDSKLHPVIVENDIPPPDKYNFVYITLIISGAAFFLPFNSFIMAVDYFQHHYPDSAIMFDMSTIYILAACVAVLSNNIMIDVFTYKTRINFGIRLSVITMFATALCINLDWSGFDNHDSYMFNLAAIGVVGFGCTVQQSSYYGFTSSLPMRYTQAVMVGESAAGFWVSIDRILTKYWYPDPTRSTFMFFFFSILFLLGHSILHQIMMNHPLVLYYLRLTAESRANSVKRIELHLNPTEEINLTVAENTDEPAYGVLSLQSPTVIDTSKSLSFANPLYSPTAGETSASLPVTLISCASPPNEAITISSNENGGILSSPRRTSYKVEDDLDENTERFNSFESITRAIAMRRHVACNIYPYMVSIGLVYFITLSLYPGITSEIYSCKLGNWMPIILMSTFNFFDFVGKIAASKFCDFTRSQLVLMSALRVLLVPMMLLCAASKQSPHISGDIYPIAFCMMLGFSNGLLGSVPMIIAPTRVSREHREIAGNMMTLSYNIGLLAGTVDSYWLLDLHGSPGAAACKLYPTPILPTLPPVLTTTALFNSSNVI